MEDESILVIEDDLSYQTLIRETLDNFNVVIANTLAEARNVAYELKKQIVAVIIDINLPDGNGLRFLNELVDMGMSSLTPCIVLSGHTEISNKVSAFSLGAEDFVEKPFDPLEFKVRLNSKIEKFKKLSNMGEVKRVQDLVINLKRQKAFFATDSGQKEDLQLTVKELQLLVLLTTSIGQVYSREQILDKIWNQTSVSDRTVDSHIAHLRKKINVSKIDIKALKGVGYFAEIKS